MWLTYGFAEVTGGDISALLVLGGAASSTPIYRHTRWLIEDVGGSPELPAHINTHFSGHALSFPPLQLYTCTQKRRLFATCLYVLFQIPVITVRFITRD